MSGWEAVGSSHCLDMRTGKATRVGALPGVTRAVQSRILVS